MFKILYTKLAPMTASAVESKREAFDKVIQWLRDEGIPRVDVEPDSTKLYAKVFPLIDEPMFFHVDFRRKSNDSFVIGTTIDFSRRQDVFRRSKSTSPKPSLYGHSKVSVSHRYKLGYKISKNKSS